MLMYIKYQFILQVCCGDVVARRANSPTFISFLFQMARVQTSQFDISYLNELFHPGMSFTPGRLSSRPGMSLSFRCLVIHL